MELAPDLSSRGADAGRASAGPRQIHVIATTEDGTRAALFEAGHLSARVSAARVVLLVPRIVSPLTPADDARDAALVTKRYRDLMSAAGVVATVRMCVCRRYADLFRWMVGPRATIVVGGHRRWWWPTAEQRMARQVERAGHEVVFADIHGGRTL